MDAPQDAELEQLVAQLLRAVIPAAAADVPSGPAGAADAGEAAENGVGGGQFHAGEDGAGGAAPEPPVSLSEARALTELLTARGIAQGQLAALLGLEKSTVSRLAAGLERKGWVRRGRDEGNQRYVRLYLTPEGRLLAGRVWRAWQSRQARILAGLSDGERAGLAAGLRGLIRGLAAEGLMGDLPRTIQPAVGRGSQDAESGG
ncbi:MAG: MarR family transcriptional regulator [Actinobacteria bacterium]|nr:MarR family transcriptional regulator [Actinomycetota bacterium]